MIRTDVQHRAQLFLRNAFLFPQITDTAAKFFRIKSHGSVLSSCRTCKQAETPFSSPGLFFRLKIHNDRDTIELFLRAALWVLSAFNAFQAIFLLRNRTVRHGNIIASNFITVKH